LTKLKFGRWVAQVALFSASLICWFPSVAEGLAGTRNFISHDGRTMSNKYTFCFMKALFYII
jgi:hypothetical protein